MALSSDLRQELQNLLRRQAILYSTPSAPITHRTGEISEWAFYSWNITLTEKGLRLAAKGILEALKSFGSTQLSSYGYTGLPILSACILEGGGKYTGLSIRERRKTHLTNRRVDGVIDRNRSVVIIDDSLSSGTSLHKAITALEEEGLEVEGTITLVHFPYRGSKDWANAAGYRTVTLFDIWSDLGMAAVDSPYRGAHRERWHPSTEQMPDGIAPAALARLVAEFYLATRQIPRWPSRLDSCYDARGGTYVSFRRRTDDNRVARDGFWHFDHSNSDPARDVVLATIDTLERGGYGLTLESLADLKIGVTFLGPLEEISPAKLDFDRYGIVVRSNVWPSKLGGALPNTQVFISEIEQYRHARRTNAQVADTEPHTLYRHTITKFVEAGETWLPYGCAEDAATSWWRDERIGRLLTSRAREGIAATSGNSVRMGSLSNSLIPVPVEGVAVTVYSNGLSGYGFSRDRDLDRAVVAAAETAWRDPRYAANRSDGPEQMALTVSVLHHGEEIWDSSRVLIERKVRRGLDAVTLRQGGKYFTVLPSALVYNNWSRRHFLDVIEASAGGRQPLHSWRTHQVAAWVSGSAGTVLPLRFGFPARRPLPCDDDQAAASIDLLASYIFRAIGPDGIPAYRLSPSDVDYVRVGTAGRVLHALYALRTAGEVRERSDWKDAAANAIARCLGYVRSGMIDLPRHVGGPLADAVLLSAASVCGAAQTQIGTALAERVASLLHNSGWIGAGAKRLDNPQDQEFLPGATAWSLATYCRATGTRPPDSLNAARRFYHNRLHEHPTWGCSWLAQGWAAVHDLTGDSEDAAITFDAADWVAARQLEKNGAFLEDLSPDEPSFNTGFVAEGVAGAWRVALARNDEERASRYGECWRKAAGFMRTLTLEETDIFPFRLPERALGGVRCTVSRADIRIDQVSHTLHALVEGYQNAVCTENVNPCVTVNLEPADRLKMLRRGPNQQ
jgi:orotate phosphoribosyltransferase/AMMECR1 domain-containing protein